ERSGRAHGHQAQPVPPVLELRHRHPVRRRLRADRARAGGEGGGAVMGRELGPFGGVRRRARRRPLLRRRQPVPADLRVVAAGRAGARGSRGTGGHRRRAAPRARAGTLRALGAAGGTGVTPAGTPPGGRYAAVAPSRSSPSSPEWYISTTMSAPPISSPLT